MLRLLRSSALLLFSLLTWAPESDAIEFTKVLRRECAAQGSRAGDGNGGNGGSCGVAVRSNFADAGDVEVLRSVSAMTAERAETDAALSVYDFESNGITHGDRFATFWDKLRPKDLEVVRRLTDRVADFILETFHASEGEWEGVKGERVLFLTKPLFLSFIDGSKNSSADYSFFHVDRDTKQHFLYSALLYLDDGSGEDFAGGELVFAAKRRPRPRPFTVSPRAGKLVAFSSGAENPHLVSLVTAGRRRALTMFFTNIAELSYCIEAVA